MKTVVLSEDVLVWRRGSEICD